MNTEIRNKLADLAISGQITWKELAILMLDAAHPEDCQEVYDMLMAKRRMQEDEEANTRRTASAVSTGMSKCMHVVRHLFRLRGTSTARLTSN